MLDFSKRFNHDVSRVHSNICGTQKELLEYCERTIINGRKLVLPDGLSLEDQIKEIAKSSRADGIIAFVFEDEEDKLGICLENQKIFIERKRKKKKH